MIMFINLSETLRNVNVLHANALGAKYTEAQNKATQKYPKTNYDQLSIRIPKGKREEYKNYATSKKVSLAQLITDLIEADIKSN